MKRLLVWIILLLPSGITTAQTGIVFHQGTFNKKGKVLMSSHQYKPDDWEKPYFDSAIRTAFPLDLVRNPEKYKGRLIHLIGLADSVYTSNDSVPVVHLLLDNRYWDYVEDYSIQDEVMFISQKGGGKFSATLNGITPEQLELLKKFPSEKKLLLVYGNFSLINDGQPVLAAQQIKVIDYEWYSDKIYSYEIKRDNAGNVVTDKRGKVQLTDYHFFKIAKAGQNK